jgi:hypothetical protein
MKTRHGLILALSASLLIAAGSAQAGDRSGDALLGGLLGGGLGAVIGQQVGGRDGAIVGGAVGAATGVYATTSRHDHHRERHEGYGYGAPVYYARPAYVVPERIVYYGPRVSYVPIVRERGPWGHAHCEHGYREREEWEHERWEHGYRR